MATSLIDIPASVAAMGTDLITAKHNMAEPSQPHRHKGPGRLKIYRIRTGKILANGEPAIARSLRQMEVPLCSFGPGGEYMVDWYGHRYRPQQLEEEEEEEEEAKAAEIFSPLQLLFREIRDVFLGIHPGRRYRSEARPELLEPCPACG
ncbi:MAG: hypothetical protein ACP5VQ_03580, partial [Phycisphaerae bacterium]